MYYKTKWNLTRQSGKMTLSASTKSLKFRFPDLQVQKFHFVWSNSTLSCRNFESMKSQLSNAVSTKSVRLFVQKLSQCEISEFGQSFGLEPIKKIVTNSKKLCTSFRRNPLCVSHCPRKLCLEYF